MADDRDGRGRFAQGVSGHRRGRPRKQLRQYTSLADLDEDILRILTEPRADLPGGERTGFFGYNILLIATNKSPNPIASQRVVWIATGAAKRADARREQARIEAEGARQRQEIEDRTERYGNGGYG